MYGICGLSPSLSDGVWSNPPLGRQRGSNTPKMVQQICSWAPPGKNVSVFRLEPHRPCLDWPLRIFLTSQPISKTLNSDRKSWKIWVSGQFFHKSVDCKNVQKIFLSTLICHLQMTNWQWTPIFDPSCHKCMLYPLPIKKIPIRWLIFLRTVDEKKLSKNIF